ncbi:MAG TPA: adenylate kinase [Fimbriimonadaceae bacterium]|nr:adenylate kinase [Fimbriimonadaceae bacterium]
MRLILIGPPGVGKGTQAALLHERHRLAHLSSGVIFREEIANQTPLGLLAKGFLDKGELVPDAVTIEMMAAYIRRPDVVGGFLLDGFPRTVAQAEALDCLLDDLGLPIERAISIHVDDEVVVERLSGRLTCSQCGEIYHRVNRPPLHEGVCDKCGGELIVRADDQPETIRKRLRLFHETTEPVIGYYARSGRLVRIDGTRSPEEVYQSILESLKDDRLQV